MPSRVHQHDLHPGPFSIVAQGIGTGSAVHKSKRDNRYPESHSYHEARRGVGSKLYRLG